MKNNKLIIVSEKETKLANNAGDLFYKNYDLLVISNDKKKGIFFLFNGKKIFLRNYYLMSMDYKYDELSKDFYLYKKYINFAKDLEFISNKIFSFDKNDFDRICLKIYIYAKNLLYKTAYKKIVFLSPISDFVIISFAIIAQKLEIAKFIQRTGIQDKIFFSKDFLDKSIEIVKNDNSRKSKQKNFLDNASCVWNDYSKFMNTKSLASLSKKSLNSVSKKDVLSKKLLNKIKLWKKLDQLSFKLPVIYYPLHCDPGRTTQPEADIFQNQLLSIYIISKFLGKKFTILVKEHPRQFDEIESFNKYRGIDFYDVIQTFKSVQIVSLYENNKNILDICSCVATANGTTGWEALKIGKPVILFGKPWYSNVRGCLNISELLNDKNALNQLIDQSSDIKKSAKSLENYISGNFFSLPIYDRIYDFLNKKEMPTFNLEDILKYE